MAWLVHVSGPADRQILRVDLWWRKNRQKAPDLFTQQIGWAIGFLSETPLLGSPVIMGRRHLRRLLMRKTSYYVYYDVNEQAGSVEIRAVWHASRGKTPRL